MLNPERGGVDPDKAWDGATGGQQPFVGGAPLRPPMKLGRSVPGVELMYRLIKSRSFLQAANWGVEALG